MNRFALFVSTCMLLAPAAVIAQGRTPIATPAAPAVGATVYDSAGVAIGTIDSITPQAIVLAVGTTKIAVPPTSVGATAKGLAMAMTKADLEAAQAQQQAAAQAAVKSRLVAGAAVNGLNGTPIGTIKSTSADMVTLTTSKGDVQLPSSGFTADASGQLILGLTQAQLDTAMGGASAAASTTTGTSAGMSTDTPAATATAASPAATSTTTTTTETKTTKKPK